MKAPFVFVLVDGEVVKSRGFSVETVASKPPVLLRPPPAKQQGPSQYLSFPGGLKS